MNWIPSKLRQLASYSVVGVLNTATDFLVFTLCISVPQFNLLFANFIAFAIAVTQGYVLNKRYTFRQSGGPQGIRSYLYYVAINLGGLAVSSATILLLSNWTGPLLAKLASVVFVLFWGFLMARRFVFNGQPDATSTQTLTESRSARLAS